MGNDWKLDWREILGLETTALLIAPRKGLVLEAHKLVEKFALLRPQKIAAVRFVEGLLAFLHIATGGK